MVAFLTGNMLPTTARLWMVLEVYHSSDLMPLVCRAAVGEFNDVFMIMVLSPAYLPRHSFPESGSRYGPLAADHAFKKSLVISANFFR